MPFQDRKVLELVLKFTEDLKPYGVVLNGDIVDCYQISTYTKDPMKKSDLSTEVKLGAGLMERLAKVTKERYWIEGNHEDRLRRYVADNAPKLGVLEGIDFPTIFGLSEFGFQHKTYGEYLMLGKLLVTHGDIVRKWSSWSGKAHFDKYGTSVLTGHTHRLGIFYHTNIRGIHAAYENGCLCDLRPEYVQHPDWQQGFSVVNVDTGGWFNVQQIPILNRQGFYFGREWVSNGRS